MQAVTDIYGRQHERTHMYTLRGPQAHTESGLAVCKCALPHRKQKSFFYSSVKCVSMCGVTLGLVIAVIVMAIPLQPVSFSGKTTKISGKIEVNEREEREINN